MRRCTVGGRCTKLHPSSTPPARADGGRGRRPALHAAAAAGAGRRLAGGGRTRAGGRGGRSCCELFEQTVYGRVPEADALGVCFKQWSSHGVDLLRPADDPDHAADAGPVRALCRQGELVLPGGDGSSVPVLVYEPADAGGPVPCFIGLNFEGNAAVTDDAAVRAPAGFNERERGMMKRRWPLCRIVGGGFAVMTSWYEAWAPDHPKRWRDGAAPAPQPGALDAGGAVALWAWGLRRMLDAASALPSLDARRVAVLGHSRLGKAALWAAALDERFALAVSNDSGCGGAALFRRCFGETVARINDTFPHWFCPAFHGYGGREAELPVDQHQLLTLLAPRPVAVGSASEDLWADPRGEFLSLVHAGARLRPARPQQPRRRHNARPRRPRPRPQRLPPPPRRARPARPRLATLPRLCSAASLTQSLGSTETTAPPRRVGIIPSCLHAFPSLTAPSATGTSRCSPPGCPPTSACGSCR